MTSQQLDRKLDEMEEKFNDVREKRMKLEEDMTILNERMHQFMSRSPITPIVQSRSHDSKEL